MMLFTAATPRLASSTEVSCAALTIAAAFASSFDDFFGVFASSRWTSPATAELPA